MTDIPRQIKKPLVLPIPKEVIYTVIVCAIVIYLFYIWLKGLVDERDRGDIAFSEHFANPEFVLQAKKECRTSSMGPKYEMECLRMALELQRDYGPN